MGCSCKKKKLEAETAAKSVASSVTVEVPTVPILVRDGDHPLACEFCFEKHVAVAPVYAVEYAEAPKDMTAERLLCFAHLSCAEEHAPRSAGRTTRQYPSVTAGTIEIYEQQPLIWNNTRIYCENWRAVGVKQGSNTNDITMSATIYGAFLNDIHWGWQ